MRWSIVNAEAPDRSAPSKQQSGWFNEATKKMKIQRRRRRKLFWLFAAAAVCALLFEEQAAVLYVLATLATGGLLIVLAISRIWKPEMQTVAHQS